MNRPVPEDFHAHIYFTDATRASAMDLRQRLATAPEFCVELQPVRDRPMGPHPTPMFNAHIDDANLAPVIHWLMRNHGPHSVLIHPESGDELRDHTDHAMWLGTSLPLRLEALS